MAKQYQKGKHYLFVHVEVEGGRYNPMWSIAEHIAAKRVHVVELLCTAVRRIKKTKTLTYSFTDQTGKKWSGSHLIDADINGPEGLLERFSLHRYRRKEVYRDARALLQILYTQAALRINRQENRIADHLLKVGDKMMNDIVNFGYKIDVVRTERFHFQPAIWHGAPLGQTSRTEPASFIITVTPAITKTAPLSTRIYHAYLPPANRPANRQRKARAVLPGR